MNDAFELPFPQYRCPTCGKDLPLGEARMTVTCASHTQRDDRRVHRPPGRRRRPTTRSRCLCERALGETDVDVFGRTFDVLAGVNLIAVVGEELVGLLALAINRGELDRRAALASTPTTRARAWARRSSPPPTSSPAKRGLASCASRSPTTTSRSSTSTSVTGSRSTTSRSARSPTASAPPTPGFSGIPVRDEIRLRRAVCVS